MKTGRNGVSSNTPKAIMFGAGTIHKNLKYTIPEGAETGSWNFAESIIGATSGGSKFTVTPEVTPVEVDGAWVAVKGLEVKTGEVAEMEINLAELTEDIIKTSTLGELGVSEDALYNLIQSKADIQPGDYWDNIAFVGKKLDGKFVIVIMPNALCTSGLEGNTENKNGSVGTYTFGCHAELEEDLDKLPWKIYYPVA